MAVGLSGAVAGCASSHPVRQIRKLTASDGTAGDNFGKVAIDGETALVGAPGNAESTGAAYVFTKTDDGWHQDAKLIASDGNSADIFGNAVALSSDTALIAAAGDADPNGNNAGSAYVFDRTGDTWHQQAKLSATDGDENDSFGFSVALSGETALVGAALDEDPNGVHAGSVYVFSASDGRWRQHAKLVADDGDASDFFGDAVAVSGDTAIIGAPEDEDPNGPNAGSAYIFRRAGDRWRQEAKLVGADGNADDRFGDAVAITGNTALVGASSEEAPNGVNAGAAYFFTRSGRTWRQRTKISADDGTEGDLFGFSVALSGRTALIGAAFDQEPSGFQAGSAYVFSGYGSNWVQRAKLAAADGDGGDFFGSSVALSGDTALVGASSDEDPNGFDAGSAYLFGPATS